LEHDGRTDARLDLLGIPYDVTPGVPAFAAAAAALNQELTLPNVAQISSYLTRTSTRSTPMPAGEELATLGRTGATLAIHLSNHESQNMCPHSYYRFMAKTVP